MTDLQDIHERLGMTPDELHEAGFVIDPLPTPQDPQGDDMKRFPQIRSAAIWWVMTIIYVVTYFAQVFTGRDPDALLPLLICAGVATILMTLHEINVRVTVIQKTQRDEVVNKVFNLVRQEFLVKRPGRGAEPTFTVFDEHLGRNNDTIGDEL